MKSSFTFLAVLLCLAACQVEIVDPNVSNRFGDVLSAQIEQNEVTKTVLSENNNVLWSDDDQIVAFMKSSYRHKYQIIPSFVGKTYADFSRISSANGADPSAEIEWDHNIAYYPYSESVECVKSGDNYALNVVLPAEQTYEANSFGNGAFPMVAVSDDNNITFYNICGGIKLHLKGTQMVKSLAIQGNTNEILSGEAIVKAYTDEAKPTIIMTDFTSTSVVLNCGAGVQLNEEGSTAFIISLPPVKFWRGFTVTVTDENDKTYILQTSRDHSLFRSSLLVMPPVKLENPDYVVPVDYVNMQVSNLKLCKGTIAQLKAIVGPRDATDKTVFWSSDNPAVAIINQEGMVEALNLGVANITATSGGKFAKCSVSVSDDIILIDYVDEYNENHGKGIVIGNTVWAPVNCGYHTADYQYGKLYQWGRKYGQGYSGDICEFYTTETDGISIKPVGEISDATVPIIIDGGVSRFAGSHKSNENFFYRWFGDQWGDWLDPHNDTLWNSGTEDNPVKTDYDPCPQGWRVPTRTELFELSQNKSDLVYVNGLPGVWLSGGSVLKERVPKIFLPATGKRTYDLHKGVYRGWSGHYWSSTPQDIPSWSNSVLVCGYGGGSIEVHPRSNGMAVRCVQE